MSAVDSNILAYAHREDYPWHEPANQQLTGLAEGATPWAIPWPYLQEFLAIVTHPRIFKTLTPLKTACDQVDAWLKSPRAILLAEIQGYWPILRQAVLDGKIQGPPSMMPTSPPSSSTMSVKNCGLPIAISVDSLPSHLAPHSSNKRRPTLRQSPLELQNRMVIL